MSSQEHNEVVDDAEDPVDPRLSELVAYLDGELDDSACENVERELVSNPGLRRYAETLDRTWQLLDSLGDAPASGAFTQKTLASIASIAPDSTAVGTSSNLSLLKRVPVLSMCVWFAAAFIGTSAGLMFSRTDGVSKSNPKDVELLENLSLLESYEKYFPVPSLEFLQRVSELKAPKSAPEEPKP